MFVAAACALIALVRTMPAWRVDLLGGPPRFLSLGEAVLFFVIGYGVLSLAYLYPLVFILLEVFPDVSQVRYSRLAELLDISPFSALAQFAVLGAAGVFSGIFSILVINVGRFVFLGTMIPATSIFYNLLIYSYDRLMPKVCKSADASLCMSYLEMGFLFAFSVVLSLLLFQQAMRYFRGVQPYRYS